MYMAESDRIAGSLTRKTPGFLALLGVNNLTSDDDDDKGGSLLSLSFLYVLIPVVCGGGLRSSLEIGRAGIFRSSSTMC
jgi:hypothetical protein